MDEDEIWCTEAPEERERQCMVTCSYCGVDMPNETYTDGPHLCDDCLERTI